MCSNFKCNLILLRSPFNYIFEKTNMEHFSIRKLLVNITFLNSAFFPFFSKEEDHHEIDDDAMEEPSKMISAKAIAIAHTLVKTCLSQICENIHIAHIH